MQNLSTNIIHIENMIYEIRGKQIILNSNYKCRNLAKFGKKKIASEIFYDGQIYDAYSKILDILKTAKNKLVLLDGYADKTLLDITRNLKVNTTIITNSNNNAFKNILKKYIKQYNNVRAIYNNSFHDRYFIIDNKKIYHCGTSIKNAGSKTFSINLLEDELINISLINKINDIIKEKV